MLPTNNLKYEIILTGYGSKIVYPLGEGNFKMQFALSDDEDNAQYSYQAKFSGSLKFVGEDFDFLYGAESGGYRCADMTIEISSTGCSGSWEQILDGAKIRLSDGQWNIDNCFVVIPISTPDPYECINEKKGDELNIFDAGGGEIAVQLYDYDPTFEYQISAKGEDGMDFLAQNFENYPNRRAEYPNFGCENEEADAYWPETGAGSTTLFVTEDLRRLQRNATTHEEILSTGSLPYHSAYPSPWDAVADGWRLVWFKYIISNTPDPIDNNLNWVGRWKWCRETKDVLAGDPAPGPEWVFIAGGPIYDTYARPPILVPRVRKYEPSKQNILFPGAYEVKFTYSNYVVGETTSIVESEDGDVALGDGNIFGFKELPNGKFLNEIIVQSVAHCCPDLTVKSDFFQINPDVLSTENYVTGEDSFTDEIVVFQKSDIKRPWAASHATVGIYRPEELWQWLWHQFKVKYTIDGNYFRLEHKSSAIFRKPYTIDTTIAPYNRYIAKSNRYSYLVEGLKAKETFAFMEARKQVAFSPDDDFAGMPITYYGNCVNRKEKQNIQEHRLNRITNDVLFILINSGGAETQVTDNETANSYKVTSDVKRGVISDDGFTFVASVLDGSDRRGVVYPAILSDNPLFNNVLGWAHLHDKFYRDDMNAPEGTINGNDVTFDSTKYVKKQVRISLDLCCISGFDPHEKIKTEMGEGVIQSAEWSAHNSVLAVDLLYQV